MKRLIIALGLILSFSSYANAQGAMQMGTPEQRANRQIGQLETLKLSDEQITKLIEVFTWSRKRIDSIKTILTNGIDFPAFRAKMAPIEAETTTKVNALLNDEQKKAYEAILEKRRA
jgi:hypothetical protein